MSNKLLSVENLTMKFGGLIAHELNMIIDGMNSEPFVIFPPMLAAGRELH